MHSLLYCFEDASCTTKYEFDTSEPCKALILVGNVTVLAARRCMGHSSCSMRHTGDPLSCLFRYGRDCNRACAGASKSFATHGYLQPHFSSNRHQKWLVDSGPPASLARSRCLNPKHAVTCSYQSPALGRLRQ